MSKKNKDSSIFFSVHINNQCRSKVKNDQFKTFCKDEERGIKVQNILTFSPFAAPSVRQRLTHCLSAQQNDDCAKTE